MISIVTADDSAFLRQVLKDVLEASGKVRVLAAAKNGKEAVDFVKKHKPDVLILDCEMPVMNGLEALRTVMAECPLPVFMFSSLTHEGASVTIKALEYGAVDFLPKPASGAEGIEEISRQLIRKVEAVSLKGRFMRLRAKGPASPRSPARSGASALPKKNIELVVMGSSTGGVQAAMNVVPKFPKYMPPIVWVQHMPAFFTKSFAERLDGLSQVRVKEAESGDVLEAGTCYLAPGGQQMLIQKTGGRTTIKIEPDGERKSLYKPACDVLFESVAQFYGDNVLGIILTGMGNDGTKGLSRLRSKGAYVIGQDEESCVVYGMPKAAFEAGAVDIQCDIHEIAETAAKVAGASTGAVQA